jgi:hypothetical protein
MESKEKAIELYNKFYNTSSHPHHVESRQQFAKQCAMIAVDEIIQYLQDKWDTVGFAEYLIDMNKYIEVKQELEKL